MHLSNLSIEELQRLGRLKDTAALIELGLRVLDFDFCLSDTKYCESRFELEELKNKLDVEIPESCPHCGQWLTGK